MDVNKYTEKQFCPCFNPDNGNNGQTGNGRELLERIRSLSFVKAELELYLDTHPKCKVALDYYYQTVDALTKLVDEYQAKYGPLTAMGTNNTEMWTWASAPWPWHRDSDKMNNEWMGER